jgi:hypothetical protein
MTLVLLFNQRRLGPNYSTQAQQFVNASGTVTPGGTTAAATSGAIPAMRTYGRVGQVNGMGGTWVEVTTDANGYNDQVYLTALAQTLKLNLGESPFWANYGIPAQQSVTTNVFPDYYVIQTQTQYAPFFASLVITRIPGTTQPAYTVTAVTHSGATLQTTIAT